MTSDAKIGLLLGLVFIFIIAFIINGLPGLRTSSNNNELTTQTVKADTKPQPLAARERKAAEVFNQIRPIVKEQLEDSVPAILTDNNEIRFRAPLPKITPVAAENVEVTSPVVEKTVAVKQVLKPETRWPKTYLVSDGDNLATIAKKVYGSDLGNKKVNVDRIFKANRKLASADEIYIGQKLTIPAPIGSTKDNRKITNVISATIKKPKKKNTTKTRVHVVRDGDSLWEIASAKLGNGGRYNEITKLNSDILSDEDNLVVGMRLKMPVR
jgi:nucleoid-associated protein YgaU